MSRLRAVEELSGSTFSESLKGCLRRSNNFRECSRVAKLTSDRSGFRDWVRRQPVPESQGFPLTHITKGLLAEDIYRAGEVAPTPCDVFEKMPLAYFFYGRPAYRVGGDGAIKAEAACPFCFIFDGSVIDDASKIFPFDTGAFNARLYKHAFTEEMELGDFSLDVSVDAPRQLIRGAFRSERSYIDGNTTDFVSPEEGAEAWEMHARAYLSLIGSRGRNEPDDRLASIEVLFERPVLIPGNLKAVVVPHTFWRGSDGAPWLSELARQEVEICPFQFLPGRAPDYYYALIEAQVKELYKKWGMV